MTEDHPHLKSLFHPLIHQWFQACIGTPTTVQQNSWSRIAAGEHVLITAPTGSGKTLTAFLWAINQLINLTWPGGSTRVLYISPLKALNNDIQRNLMTPLTQLEDIFERNNLDFPGIRVQTRSGDTPQSERRRMLRHPPEILITTPESLNLLLSSAGGRTLLGDITTVILDEIHAVVGNKRGVHLISAVDRLVRLSGEFQRICLSATVKPLTTVAEFAGGYHLSGSSTTPRYTPRPVSVIRSQAPKQYEVEVRFPRDAAGRQVGESIWKPLAREFKRIIGRNRATLLFTNSRRLCEKLTLKINRGESRTTAYAHHGSLSRLIREEVESRLKTGDLKAIVATNSLELGIDIGDLDEVVLIQSPPSVSAAIQRVGRAGHRLGGISKGTLFPTHALDFLEAAVLAAAIPTGDIEEISPVHCPLDVLAQIVVSMVGVEVWDRDDLYAWIKTSYPYRQLSRAHYDLVLNMLAGRYAESRIRELKPRISIDGLDKTVVARPGALLTLYTSGGVIPDRGYYHLRHLDTNARIGELDEEFVWEATIGQVFTLGTQNWKIAKITHNDVFVAQAGAKAMAAPFWKGEQRQRDFHFSSRLAEFLEYADERLDTPDFLKALKANHFMNEIAAKELVAFLKRQKAHTGTNLPHRHHLIIEYISAGPGSAPGHQLVLHTVWGGRLNHPFALALSAAWEEKFTHKIEVYADNDCISLMLPHKESPETLLSLVTSARLGDLLQKRLEGSGFFGARFRECAGRALLINRRKMNERVPLWMSRLRSQKLLEAVSGFKDFPILLEAWRTCLQDEFDLEHLHQMLTEIADGSISWSAVHTSRPSPMAQGMAWRQINQYMYMGDESAPGKSSRLSSDLLKDIIFSPDLRPSVPNEIVTAFESKRKRLAIGYSPGTPRDLLDWVKERLLIPHEEWGQLLEAVLRDHGLAAEDILSPLADKLLQITPDPSNAPLIGAIETLPQIIHAFYGSAAQIEYHSVLPSSRLRRLEVADQMMAIEEIPPDRDKTFALRISEWLQFYGPVSEKIIGQILGVSPTRLQLAIEALVDTRKLISGRLIQDDNTKDLCDAENFEILLRLTRSDAVPTMEPLPVDQLQLLLAGYQGIAIPQTKRDSLYDVLDQLLCYPLKAALWETEILPARLAPYRKERLDSILQETDLLWIGSQKQEVVFCFESDLDLLQQEHSSHQQALSDGAPKEVAPSFADLFADPAGRYNFSTLQRQTGHNETTLSNLLWEGVWQGCIANDSFLTLRQGIENNFKAPRDASRYMPTRRQRGRSGHNRSGHARAFGKWKQARNLPGNWFFLQAPNPTDDLLDEEERNKARVRLLLDRYGILFRELLVREAAPFRWAPLFRSLRIMELSGEVLTGYFFHGIPGLQFISPRALRFLQGRLPQEAVYWINAADPASMCGVQLDEIRGTLPRRLSSTHLVYHGTKRVMVSQRHGKQLNFHVPPDNPDLARYLGPLHHLLMRHFDPLRSITVETINDQPAATSPYLEVLQVAFETVPDYKKISLYRMRDDI